MQSLPFANRAYLGLGSMDGLIRFEGGALILEFQVKDALAGLIKSDLKQVRIPVDEIQSISLQRGWLSTSLVIQASTLRVTKGIPDSRHGQVELSIARKYNSTAEQIVAKVTDEMRRPRAQAGGGNPRPGHSVS